VTPPHVVSGPNLLTGICHCGNCGGAMTLRTGKNGRYRYYACSIRARQGEALLARRLFSAMESCSALWKAVQRYGKRIDDLGNEPGAALAVDMRQLSFEIIGIHGSRHQLLVQDLCLLPIGIELAQVELVGQGAKEISQRAPRGAKTFHDPVSRRQRKHSQAIDRY